MDIGCRPCDRGCLRAHSQRGDLGRSPDRRRAAGRPWWRERLHLIRRGPIPPASSAAGSVTACQPLASRLPATSVNQRPITVGAPSGDFGVNHQRQTWSRSCGCVGSTARSPCLSAERPGRHSSGAAVVRLDRRRRALTPLGRSAAPAEKCPFGVSVTLRTPGRHFSTSCSAQRDQDDRDTCQR